MRDIIERLSPIISNIRVPSAVVIIDYKRILWLHKDIHARHT